MSKRCAALTASGEPCRMAVLGGSLYCWAHDPERAVERTTASSRGGRNRRVPKGEPPSVSVRDLDSIRGQLEKILADTWLQENSEKRSNAITRQLAVAIDVHRAHAEAEHQAQIDERLSAIEQQLRGNLRRA